MDLRCICAEKREIVEEITKIEGRLRTLLPQIENIPCSMDAVMNKRAASTPITKEMDSAFMADTVNEDIPFDSSCRIDVWAIKYPRGGRGVKMEYPHCC
uniref:Uncharacterized protein n=1 Tax=Magallana gigas TaxID=29159 RepID=A0A8W8MIS9_MAGGI